MSVLRNSVQLFGNVGNEPEIKNLENGKKVASFSIATSESYKKDGDEKVTNTEWHNLVAWGKTAELIEKYIKKGSEIGVSGKLTYNKWEDKDGNKRSRAEIIVNEILLTGKAKN